MTNTEGLTLREREALEKAWQHADDRRAFWDAHRTEFTQLYPDQFVAASNGHMVDHDPDLLSLTQRLLAGGRDLHHIWIEFMAIERHKLLL